MKLNILDLFAGIGSFRKAMNNQNIDANYETVENDEAACKAYSAIHNDNVEPTSVVNYIPKVKPDIIYHGSPCQDFSIAGLNAGGEYGSGTRSSLLFETVRIVEETLPKIVIWENVKAAKNTNAFKDYLEAMHILGYETKFELLNSKNFGIPQERERIFAISIKGKNDFDFNKLEKQQMKPLTSFLDEYRDTDYSYNEKEIKLDFSKERRIGGAFDKNGKKRQGGAIFKDTGTIPTITAGQWKHHILLYTNNKIRLLNDLECYKLMGYTKEDWAKANEVISKTNLYKTAGNSIVVNINEAIIKELKRIGYI